jgi:drug/metabolite transporter (DMT)-like permease
MAFVPVFSALAAVPLLGESLSGITLAGLGAVTAGAVLGARQPRSLYRQVNAR